MPKVALFLMSLCSVHGASIHGSWVKDAASDMILWHMGTMQLFWICSVSPKMSEE